MVNLKCILSTQNILFQLYFYVRALRGYDLEKPKTNNLKILKWVKECKKTCAIHNK